MRKWWFLPVLVLAALSLAAGACSSGDDGDSAARSSEEREGDEGSSDDSSDPDSGSDSSDSDLGDTADSLIDEAQDTATSLLDEAEDAFGGVADCVELSLAFGKLQAATLGGDDGARQARDAAEELKELVPGDLDDDIDVIAEALGTLAEEGLTSGSTALSTPEYEAAMEGLSDYIDSECGVP